MAFCRPLAFLFVCCAVIKVGTAHFSLTYPKARFPDYDFLDNVRTGGPCGVGNGMNVSVPITIHVMSFFICLYARPYGMSHLYLSPAGGRCSIVAAGSDTLLRYCMIVVELMDISMCMAMQYSGYSSGIAMVRNGRYTGSYNDLIQC